MIKKIYFTILISVITTAAALAQTVDINFNGLGFLDNREYKDFIPRSRTYSGTRTALDFGINIDSLNHFVVGVNAMHEFGAIPFYIKVDPIAYYKFESKTWLFDAGEFPRAGLIDNFPRALLNDTLMYYRPNVQGLLARYHTDHFMQTGFIDWLSRQTQTQREQFIFGEEGKYRPSLSGPFYISHFAFLMHDAGAEVLLPGDHINDNGGAEIKLGLDFTHKQHLLDSLSFEAGGLVSFQRERGINGFKTPIGFVADAFGSYGRFSVFNELYAGQGSYIGYGDAFYERKFYDRLDLIFNTFAAKGLKGQFVLSIHKTPGYTSNQEAFRVTYDLGRRVIARFKD
ncbi:MAG: hypothetical protein JWQ84_189 [Mucilaginibacter sp.]|jgi:hypothetical protein|nr:hypothetical protein [Mucilaginibacter sp.]MDB5015357.1 hypothetical protein [Mucilaginibacter sp.]